MADQIYQNTAETGLSDGTAVTTTNSDDGAAGTAFANIQGTWTFDTDAAKSGSLGYRQTLDATARYLRADDTTVSAGERGGCGGWFYYPGGTISSSVAFVGVRTAADAQIGSLNIFSTDTKPYFYNRAGTRVSAGYTVAPVALTAGWYRFMFMYTPGGSTTTATIEAKVWDTAGTLVMHYNSGAAYDAGTTDPAGRIRFGGPTTTATGWTTFDMDNLRWGHVASGDIGDVANAAPTGSITGNQNVSAGATVNASVSVSDPDGTIASYAWSYVSASSTGSPTLTGASTAAVSFTAGSAGNLYTLQCVATDNGGATLTQTTEVRVPITGSTTGVPLAFDGTNDVGSFTIVGGSSTDGAALADASDATYLETGVALSASAQSSRFRLQPSAARTTFAIPLRLATDTGTGNAIVKLYEGSTLRKTFTTQAITSTITDYTFTVDSTTIAAIVDWGNLLVEIGFTS